MNKYPNLNTDNPFASQSKILGHMDDLCEYWNKGDLPGPIFMEINLTNICNLKCRWCISENTHVNNKKLDRAILNDFLVDMYNSGGNAVTFSGGGEPTCHPEFLGILKDTYNIGLEIGLMTNGAYPTRFAPFIYNICKWVRVSLDTIDPELYTQWKGVNKLDQVLSNILTIPKADRKANLGVNVNVSYWHTVEDIKRLINAVYRNVDYIQFRPVLPRYFEGELAELNEDVWDYLRLLNDDPKINLSLDKLNDLRNWNFFPFKSCVGHIFNPILDADGTLRVCMYHPNKDQFAFGNINEQSLSAIWNSDKRFLITQMLENYDFKNNCQICCKLTEINKFLNWLDDAQKLEDVNFL